MILYNTLTRKEDLLPMPDHKKTISLYTCGPTVYDETHIGHMRKYTMDDILKRTLTHLGYEVRHVMNITDVGHLTGDDDNGDDKLEKGAKKQGKTVWEVAKYYTDRFFDTMDALGIQRPDTVMKATDHIEAMIQLIQELEKKGYTYNTDQAVYFDVMKWSPYGQLSGQKLEDKKQAVREEVHIDPQKKHPADFALWFKRKGRFADHTMHWVSPWGDGFPGWHIECSAMSMQAFGPTIDIHTGGIDHIPVHHENEIAQSEAASGKQFVKYWVHHAFLMVDGEKMSKSKENFYTLKDIQDRGIDPMAIRYLFLQTHYRKHMNFTWEAAVASQDAYNTLRKHIFNYRNSKDEQSPQPDLKKQFDDAFTQAISNDLNTSEALAVIWGVANSTLSSKEKLDLIERFDTALGLDLLSWNPPEQIIPEEIVHIADMRLAAKKENDFQKADELRKQIEDKGFIIEDTQASYIIKISELSN